MTAQQIQWYENWLKENESDKDKRVVGSYWRYLDRYLHDKDNRVDGREYDDRMMLEPMPMNIYLYG